MEAQTITGCEVGRLGAQVRQLEGALTAASGLVEGTVERVKGALTAPSGIVEGTVERVKFQAPSTGYTVLRMNAVQASGQPPHSPLPGVKSHNGLPLRFCFDPLRTLQHCRDVLSSFRHETP